MKPLTPLQPPEGANFTPLPFPLSFSKMQDFFQCQEKFWQAHLYKTIKYVETPEQKEGKEKHYWLENYGRVATEATKDGWRGMLTEAEMDFLDKVKSIPNATILFETDSNFGFTDSTFTKVDRLKKIWDKQPDGSKYYLIGLSDLTIIHQSNQNVDEYVAIIVDYKNKKAPTKDFSTAKYPINQVENGKLQLEIYALMVFLLYPKVTKVKTQFRYLKDNLPLDEIYFRSDMQKIQGNLIALSKHIEYAYWRHINKDKVRNDLEFIHYYAELPEIKSSPLCNWCGHRQQCDHYKKSKYFKPG
jgi:hypothetical protein